MLVFRKYSRFIALPMMALMMAVSMPLGVARAALVTTEQIIDSRSLEKDRATVEAFMARDDVRQNFIEMGIDPKEASARVDGLSDAEVQQLATRIEEMPAGQGSVATAIVGAALFIFIVLLVTDLLGLTDIFPFVKGKKGQR